MKIAFTIVFVLILFFKPSLQPLQTVFEHSGGQQTATYQETIAFYKKLDKQFRNIILKQMDITDSGYPLHIALFSTDYIFNPSTWHQQGKVVLLINNGIHAGEPDGIDASMMLLRDLATGKVKAPANVAIAFIPIYNIGGALNRSAYSRVNQNGPEQYGFRGNAQNLDLNRDFIKNDSRNARAFAQIFHLLDPHIFIDNHVSDGADYQHTMTLLTTQHNKLGGPLGELLHNRFDPAIYKSMAQKNWPLIPYVNFESANPEKGWTAFYDAPRYSSGYTTLFQTIGFTPETHMLKPYKQRVQATYDLMVSMIETSAAMANEIKESRRKAIAAVQQQQTFATAYTIDTTTHEWVHFKGYTPATKKSEVTGLERLWYNRNQPFEKDIKFYNTMVPVGQITLPRAYVIPQGWHKVIELLQINGVKMEDIQSDTTVDVEWNRIEQYKSMARPYEGHHKNYDVTVSRHAGPVAFRKGDKIIYCNQRANRYLAEVLEPTAEDGFFAWNFFDPILQQKEGYSDYRWEDVAAQYLAEHPEVKVLLEEQKASNPELAGSASAQLNFVYKHSPYHEPAHMRYPVFRVER